MKLRALIVDDEPIARRTLEKLCLASHDLEVVGQSRHGAEAIEAIRELKPDIVFHAAALKHVPKERIVCGTNCGMAPMRRDIAAAKLSALGQGAALARKRFG